MLSLNRPYTPEIQRGTRGTPKFSFFQGLILRGTVLNFRGVPPGPVEMTKVEVAKLMLKCASRGKADLLDFEVSLPMQMLNRRVFGR